MEVRMQRKREATETKVENLFQLSPIHIGIVTITPYCDFLIYIIYFFYLLVILWMYCVGIFVCYVFCLLFVGVS